MQLITLDLRQVDLHGWETEKDRRCIDAIIEGIKAGDEFPPVPVRKIDDRTYVLATGFCILVGDDERVDGGHHRALGHYLAGVPLKCELFPNFLGASIPKHPISKIVLVEKPELYERKKKEFSSYR